MIVKFLPTRDGGGLGSVNYLLNERQEQGTARVLKGNEAQTRAIISQIHYKQKTTFGVLSFAEKASDISNETKQEIIKDFERHLLGDYMKDRVNILWVEHSDKDGRLELNFLIPKIDLVSGKSFNPYYDKRDRTNINLWKRTINDEYNFISPDDPKNQYNQNRHKATIEQHNTIIELDNQLKDLVSQGLIINRTHLIELLSSSGYEVTRQPKSGISIKIPNQKKPFRLKGGIYSAEFTDLKGLSELGESQSRRIQQYANRDTQAECIANRARLEKFISTRDKRNQKRYKEQTISDNITNSEHKKRDNTASYSKLNGKNIQWLGVINRNDISMPRIFSVFLAQSDRNTILSIREREIKRREQSAKRVANSSELSNRTSQQNNWQSREVSSVATTNTITDEGRNSIFTTELWRSVNDGVRDGIIERGREIARRNSEITGRDKEQAERKYRAARSLREFAQSENVSILQRLSREIQTRAREYIINTQERTRQLRQRAERDREYQNRIKSALREWQERIFNSGISQIRERLQGFAKQLYLIRNRVIDNQRDTKQKLGGYGEVVSGSIQRINNQYGGKFRESLEKQTAAAITTCGYEIERELKKPERQRMVELKRSKERSRHIQMGF
ncbi:relaxase/mobilization nuclease domain-containing protein [Campylobacter concisus]|uniref:relaxase/mobilization nuclease domain-containing protein n=1 Tax=Campylobacter concisus TaxID=199 RepID=UPI000CD8FC99|nr:relaxase/mobilization nuclease domain-containing protein [Campylobacter concisus]